MFKGLRQKGVGRRKNKEKAIVSGTQEAQKRVVHTEGAKPCKKLGTM